MDARKQKLYELLGRSVHIIVDRPVGYDHNGLIYPINYGYVPGMMGGDGEEQDAYILGISTPLSEFDGYVIGAIRRENDVEDKLVVAPEGASFHQGEIAEAVHFQEQYFDGYILPLFHKSCGVLPFRIQNGQREYLIVLEGFSNCWSLPKGHMEAGETEAETAQRELHEETGLTVQLDTSATVTIEYSISPVGKKQVVFFLGETTGTPSPRPGEIADYKWVSAAELKDYLFPDTVTALQKFIYH